MQGFFIDKKKKESNPPMSNKRIILLMAAASIMSSLTFGLMVSVLDLIELDHFFYGYNMGLGKIVVGEYGHLMGFFFPSLCLYWVSIKRKLTEGKSEKESDK